MSRRPYWGAALSAVLGACNPAADRGPTVLYASGADLQSINPLLTVHPLARQVQRYVLLTTLARYDSALVPQPYLARSWRWSDDHRRLTLVLEQGIRWHDKVPTTARDVAWTLETARDPVVGYPRLSDLGQVAGIDAPDDSTVVIDFRTTQSRFPDVLTDLAILPAHLFASVPHGAMRSAPWNQAPVGNGPFRFVRHDPNRRWVFAENPDFPPAMGGPPRLERLVLAVVDEPVTKLAALVAGELDIAGIQPAHAEYVRRDPALRLLDYPLLFTYGIVLNTRRAPFDRVEIRRALGRALDRRELVEGYVYGFGTPAWGPVSGREGTAGSAREQEGTYEPPDKEAGGRPADGSARSLPLPSAPLHFELLTVGSGEGLLEQMIQAQLGRAGFQVSIRQLELSTFLDRLYGPSHDFDAAVLGIPGDLGGGYLGPLAEVAGLSAPSDPAAAVRLFADSAPVAFIYHARGVQGLSRRVRGVEMDVRGELVTVHDWSAGP